VDRLEIGENDVQEQAKDLVDLCGIGFCHEQILGPKC
jgi:hypothetical protein